MDETERLLNKCFTCKDYPDDCGVYFMMALWKKECIFYKNKNEENV